MEKKNKPKYTVARGRIFCLDPLSESNHSNLVLVISNELHNRFADHLLVVLVTKKNVEEVRSFFEVPAQLEQEKIKVLASHLHAISKEEFFKLEHYLGKLDETTMKEVSEKIKLILDLDS